MERDSYNQTRLPKTIADAVVGDIRSNLTINGAVPVTIRDQELLREGMVTYFDEKFTGICAMMRESSSNAHRGTAADVVADSTGDVPMSNERWRRRWDWGDGKLPHPVPKDFIFPKGLTIRGLWDLWFFGYMELGIGPYRLINSKVDLKPHCYKNFTAGKKIIERLEDFACRGRKNPILPPGVTRCRDLTASQSGAIFGTIFSELIAVAY